jgi:hypothetical protein
MIFKTIPQYPAYEVSECGTVVRRINNQKEVKQSIQVVKGKLSGYLYCTLTWDENGQYIFPAKRVGVHRLVAFAWLEDPKHGQVWINHIDGNKANNHRLNIEWTTISQNIQHAFDTGLHKKYKGAEHWNYGKKVNIDTKKKMSEAKQGINHPKFKGYYFVNFKRYASANSASVELKIPCRTITSRCNSEKWRLKGWYFLPI